MASSAPPESRLSPNRKPAYSKPPIDEQLYSRIASTAGSSSRKLLHSYLIPPRSGHAFQAPASSIIRFSTPEGPQVGDLNLWNAQNPRERFWASRTRQLQSAHVSTGDRLWSSLPYLRPMVTIIKDTLGERGVQEGASWKGRVNDLLGTRCDPYVNHLLTGDSYDYHCHSNLVRAVLPFGLREADVHDVINVFQVTGLDEDERYFMEASPAIKGDYVEFFAEQDLLVAMSTCPGGDLSAWAFGDGGKEGGMKDSCRPILAEVWEVEEGVKEEVLKGWEEPKVPGYKGVHGMRIPFGEGRE